MSFNVPVIAALMVKYTRREAITEEELRMLEEWWEVSQKNRELAHLFCR